MEKILQNDYLAPTTQVIYISHRASVMVTSTIGTATSERFQDESEYESIW